MPHVEISHFAAELGDSAKRRLESDLVAAVTRAFGVAEDAISIGLEAVEQEHWQQRVYGPLITDRPAGTSLLRAPGY
ncbi:tautomerase family protein [Nocardia mexicana]|uniref:4-oxalocrotonate tautomerase n=1 Tax=Nocardia mexicana TaxID=279262 RepID=A0A370HBG0_9NOCA|nr:tautomerase family protein [Nocardia mexicana]RDI53404.1 4-oxalocrotonate tautomerase [Nocardia mexicana]